MKKWNKIAAFGILYAGIVAGSPFDVQAQTIRMTEVSFVGEAWQEENGTDYLMELAEEIDFSGLDSFLEENGEEEISFSDLVESFLTDTTGEEKVGMVMEVIMTELFREIDKNRELLLEIVLLAITFSILKNFTGAFGASYVSELCFLLVYCVLALMLLQSMQALREIVSQAVTQSVDFMKMLVPAFCVSMIFSSNLSSSAGFYQIAFLIIYLVEWIFLNLLLPLIHIYVLLVLFNHFMEEERFLNLTELFRELIMKGIHLAVMIVMGLNVVQNLISPAKDRMTQGMFGRAASVIPGVGNAVSGMGEVLLGAGIVVKNCVGAAGVVMLVMIGMVPFLKVGCLALFYRVAAAATEPVTDKRISGCLKGMAEGASLYLKLLGYCFTLLFLTIGLTTAATSFIY